MGEASLGDDLSSFREELLEYTCANGQYDNLSLMKRVLPHQDYGIQVPTLLLASVFVGN